VTERFADHAAHLAGMVPLLLGWVPELFWNATPAELTAILAPEARGGPAPLSRGELNRLMEHDRNGR
jgi:uncharacterized phage protein (TIGR02216 family)